MSVLLDLDNNNNNNPTLNIELENRNDNLTAQTKVRNKSVKKLEKIDVLPVTGVQSIPSLEYAIVQFVP